MVGAGGCVSQAEKDEFYKGALEYFQSEFENKMTRLIYNAIKTPDGTILESEHRHDYKAHTDANGLEYMVDGGLDYLRRSTNPAEELSLYDDQSHEVQRQYLKWGSYGKDGKQPLRRIKIADMETSHIEAVLRECNPIGVIRNCMENELLFRNNSDLQLAIKWANDLLFYACASGRNEMIKEYPKHLSVLLDAAREYEKNIKST